MAHIAFIGTGLIGGGLAQAAAGRGLEVVAWNRTRARAERLSGYGARVAESVAQAVSGATRVHLTMSDDAAVEAVLPAILEALGDAVLVDHTTAGPRPTAARAARLADAGVAYLHAPVFMSPAMCVAAKGIMLAAGPQEVYARVSDALDQMTSKVVYLGERSDIAAAKKIFGNAMIFAIIGGLADVYSMAADLEIDPADALSLFDLFNPALILKGRGPKMAKGDYAASFELTMARKDARLMIEAAGERPLSVLPGVAARMDALIEEGYGARDLGVLGVGAVPDRTDEG